jgi:hypothetical protein
MLILCAVDIKQVNIFPYFSPAAYTGFGDDEAGFYTVYTAAFEAIFRYV